MKTLIIIIFAILFFLVVLNSAQQLKIRETIGSGFTTIGNTIGGKIPANETGTEMICGKDYCINITKTRG